MTSLTAKDDSFTGILMHFTYKEDTYLVYINLRDFVKISVSRKWIFYEFCTGYDVMTPCSVMTFGTQNND